MFKLRNSISTHLFKVIFGVYLVVTVIVTTSQMLSEYNYVKANVADEISSLPDTFLPGLEDALWTFNNKSLHSILVGMYEVEAVSGIQVVADEQVAAIGLIKISEDRYALYDEEGRLLSEKIKEPFSELLSYEFSIVHKDYDNKPITLGKGVIYTSTEVVFDRVKHGFFLIVINSVIKTLALWFIFLYFMQRILARPLLKFARDTEKIDIDKLDNQRIEVDSKNGNELKVLENSFNMLLDKVVEEKKALDTLNASLEEQVRQRTQQLENEIQVRKISQRQAEESNRIKSTFIANVSHEIRTPMTSIYGMARFLQGAVKSEEHRNLADIIVRNCENLNALIKEILDFARLEAGRMQFEDKEYNLREAIEDTIKLFNFQSDNKNLPLIVDIHDDVPDIVTGDKKRMKQVMTNLLNNAFKFTEEGEIKVSVSRESDFEGEHLLFSVSDTGIGIPAEQRDTVFESFTQADPSTSRQFGGTGLGLAICRHFVEMMGGRIWLESEVAKGTTFFFSIPVQNQSTSEA